VGLGQVIVRTGGTERATRLSELMMKGQVEYCMCLDRVHRNAPVCVLLVVLCDCALVVREARRGRQTDKESDDPLGFRCSSCRTAVDETSSPVVFRCYSGRLRNPPLEAGLLPGSCGEPCLRPKGAESSRFPHTCTALCHPGPCQPCERAGGALQCHCGKELVARRCGDAISEAGVTCGWT
jgi:transcriptional repressor NF-X1